MILSMAVSLHSVNLFNSLPRQFPGSRIVSSLVKCNMLESTSRGFELRKSTKDKKKKLSLLVAEGDTVTTETSDKITENGEKSDTTDLNGSVVSSNKTDAKRGLKRTPLTAREKLRAARVLSRYNTETKASNRKPALGSKVLEALRDTDKGKMRSGLPEAPANMLDDSKRGMPKAGLTFELPVGMDVAIIISSFVFISTLMFATTFFVWKVGAIHFNEN